MSEETHDQTETIKADDAKAVTLTGCLQSSTEPGMWTLTNITPSPSGDKDKPAVGTAGIIAAYQLTPKEGVDLTPHTGHRVEITALEVAAKTATDDDAKVKVKETTTIKKENEPEKKIESKSKAEIERGPMPKLTVLTIKHIAPACM